MKMRKLIVIAFFLSIVTAAVDGLAFGIETITIHFTKPVAYPITVTCPYNKKIAPENLVHNPSGNEPLVYTFVTEPDFTQIGKQPVDIQITDCYNNRIIVTSFLDVIPVKNFITLETSNNPIDVANFVYSDVIHAEFAEGSPTVPPNEPGIYTVQLLCEGKIYESIVTIKEVLPPEMTALDKLAYIGQKIRPEDFIEAPSTNGDITYTFDITPDTSTAGDYPVTIICEDKQGNKTKTYVMLSVMEDREAPVFQGVHDMEVCVGDTVSYKEGVTATDMISGDVNFTVDASKVNLTQEGIYEAVYTAQDEVGNIATKKITVTVVAQSNYAEKVDELCDQILADITTPDMTDTEKAKAVFDFVISSISYVGYSDKTNWQQGAYQGFTTRKGDCYTYYAASRALLTRLGIDNMEVTRVNMHHYWNLVNLGTGWYHFDASPKSTKYECFMKTDSEVAEYGPSIGRPDYYEFDPSLYPATPETSFEAP